MTPGTFVEDIERIRKRARADLEKGAVTSNYGGDVETSIRLLNAVVATEIVLCSAIAFTRSSPPASPANRSRRSSRSMPAKKSSTCCGWPRASTSSAASPT